MSILGRLAKPKPVISDLTHGDLVKRAGVWLRNTRKCVLVALEAQGHSTYEFPDAIGWDTHGCSTLVECKTSVADFRQDAVKWFRRDPERGMGQLRYFLTPVGLLAGQALPARWGLLEVTDQRVLVVRKPERFPAAAAAAVEAPLLVRTVRAKAAGWDGHERVWACPGKRPVQQKPVPDLRETNG